MKYLKIQSQYDKIYSYFKNTCESFDLLEWDGKVLQVWNRSKIVEIYKYADLKEFGVLN